MPWLAAATPKAPSITSTMRCEVSTLPPTIAGQCSAGRVLGRVQQALRQHNPDRRQHALVQRDVFVDQAAQTVHHGRGDDRPVGVQIARHDRACAGEVERGRVAVDGHGHGDRRAIVEMIDEAGGGRGQSRQGGPHVLLGGALDVPHVGLDDRQRIALDQAGRSRAPCRLAAIWARDIGQVVVHVARRVAGRRAARFAARPSASWPASTSLKLRISTPSSARFLRKGGHRAGHDAADLGMMGPAGGEEQQSAASLVREPE